MSCRSDNVYSRSPDVIACDSEYGLLLLPLVNGVGDVVNNLYVTGDIGRRIWQRFDGRAGVTVIAREMVRDYQSPSAVLTEDVAAFADELLQRGLICEKSAGTCPAPSAGCADDKRMPGGTAAGCRPGLTAGAASDVKLAFPSLLALLTAVLKRGASFRFRARGASMMPFIRDGDVLTVVPSGYPAKAGDVLVFRTADPVRLVVHRFIRQTAAGLFCRGDGAAAAAETIPRDNVLGRVVRIERNGRNVRFGLGREGRWLAALSRRGWLQRLLAAGLH